MAQLLIFRLGEEVYGLEISAIQEILEAPTVCFLPRAPWYLQGVVNLHGNVVPILDLVSYLGFSDEKRAERKIVLSPNLCRLALSVSSIHRIVKVEEERFLAVQNESEQGACVRAVVPHEGMMVNVMDVSLLLAGLAQI